MIIPSPFAMNGLFFEEKCDRIRSWEEGKYTLLINFIKEITEEFCHVENTGPGMYKLSFSGDSRGKKVLAALRKNDLFWQRCWYSSTRHYVFVFEIPVHYL